MKRVLCLLIYALLFNHNLYCGELYQNLFVDVECVQSKNNSYDGKLKKLTLYDFFSMPDQRGALFLNYGGYEYEKHIKGISAGLGVRRVWRRMICGINGFYDYQYEGGGFDQVGVGFDWYFNTMLLYGNGYIPLVRSCEKGGTTFNDYIGDYEVVCVSKRRTARGFDLNFCNLIYRDRFLHFSYILGIYGLDFSDCADKALGIQGALRGRFFNIFYIEPRFSSDRIYGTDMSIKVEFYCPLYKEPLKKIYQPVRRKGFVRSQNSSEYTTNY